jgi:hypothetical protein
MSVVACCRFGKITACSEAKAVENHVFVGRLSFEFAGQQNHPLMVMTKEGFLGNLPNPRMIRRAKATGTPRRHGCSLNKFGQAAYEPWQPKCNIMSLPADEWTYLIPCKLTKAMRLAIAASIR